MEPISIDPNELRDGDVLVVRIPYHAGNPVAFGTETPTVRSFDEVVRGDYGAMKKVIEFHGPYTVSGERPVPPLPTKKGAVLYPYDPAAECALATDEYGHWYGIGSSAFTEEEARECLTEGTHYVAFEGVNDA